MTIVVREAIAADAAVVADIDLAARTEALPTVRWAHTPDEVRGWIANVLLPGGDVWVAEEGGLVLGYLALHDDFIAQLYLRPGHWRRGIGATLMRHAKRLRPDGLRLWCFQVNTAARAFYAAQDFVAVEFTDGSGNEEQEPDILFAWRPKMSSGETP
jgi:GNAT superfamily N-acetyltransferase